MKWVPYHRFELQSPLRSDDALRALASHVEPRKWFRIDQPSTRDYDDRFEGNVTADAFDMRRILGYHNSFLPVVRGRVEATGTMSRITITMRPFISVIAFLTVFCLLALTLTGTAFAVGLIMVAYAYIMTMGLFWFEVSKQERVLRGIFQAT